MRTSVLAKLGSSTLSTAAAHHRGAGLLLLGAACLLSATAHADTLPTGGTVAQGQATIATGPGSVTVTQTSSRSVINWNGFSVGADKSVTFNQPNAQSATLNRVTGSTTSQIAGHITVRRGTIELQSGAGGVSRRELVSHAAGDQRGENGARCD